MKKIKLFVMLLAVAAITSCEKDDSTNDSSSILGKWYIKQTVETEFEGGIEVDKETETDFNSQDYVEFTSGGRMIEKDHSGYSDERNYSIVSGKLILSEIGDPNDKEEYEIKELTASKLVLYNDETEVYQGVTYREIVEVTFQR